jgi:predicted transcriptional regulator
MARPRNEQPTPAELEILKVLWDREGPIPVREVLDAVNAGANEPRAYTTVMSLLNVMTDKGLLRRRPRGRAFVYEPSLPREQTLRSLLGETLRRVYGGSTRLLMAHLLDQSQPGRDELDAIRSLLDAYEDQASPRTENEPGSETSESKPAAASPGPDSNPEGVPGCPSSHSTCSGD